MKNTSGEEMDKSLSTAQKSLLKSVCEQEKRLKSFKNDTIVHAVEILRLQEELRENYQSLILQHPDFGAFVTCKDIEEKLWKLCFYIKIEEYRKSIRKTLTLRDEKESIASNPAAASLALKARTHLAKLVAAFTKFLSDGSSFYQDLMLKLESGFKGYEQKHQSNNISNGGLQENFILCIYRCLMYLGDLARYRELYCDNKDKDYSEAQRYYERASFLSDVSGHPHNQLAVLASYLEKDCIAVYHYCRSVMILKPFLSGYDNLGLIFDKNLRAYNVLLNQSKNLSTQQLSISRSGSGSGSGLSAKDKKKSLSLMAQSLLIRFIRLHGEMFEWTHTTVKAINEKQKAVNTEESSDVSVEDYLKASTEPYVALDFDITKFPSLVQEVLSDFEYFMQNDESSIFSEILLVRLLAISIFSVHYPSSIFCENQSKSSDISASDKSVTKSLALYFLFNFISRCATLYGMIPTYGNKMIESNARRVLPVLTVFAEWCVLNPEYLGCPSLGCDSRSNRRSKIGERVSLKEKERAEAIKEKMTIRRAYYNVDSILPSNAILKIEDEARESMRRCISSLEDLISPSVGTQAQKSSAKNQEAKALLREDIELRGFLPLKKIRNDASSDFRALVVTQPQMIPDELARTIRLRDLSSFIEKIKGLSFINVTASQQLSHLGNTSLTHEIPLGVSGNSSIVNGSQIYYKGDSPVRQTNGESNEQRAELTSIAPVVIIAAQQKVEERERSKERFFSKMENLSGLIAEEKETMDQNRKRLGRGDSPSGLLMSEKKEQIAGLLSVGPGVLIAARQKEREKEKERERNVEHASKIRGERRPGGKLVETRTNSSTKGSTRKERRAAAAASGEKGRVRGDVRELTEFQREDRVSSVQAEFPPLPGAREPFPHVSPLNYASSALFTSTAPAVMNPFAEDESDESAEYSDSDADSDKDGEGREEEEGDDSININNNNNNNDAQNDMDEAGLDDFSKPDLDAVGEGEPICLYENKDWTIATNMSSHLQGATVPPAPAPAPTFSYDGLFSRPATASGHTSLFSAYSSQMDLMPSNSAPKSVPFEVQDNNNNNNDNKDDDDDFADDVVVFRPAFSRFNANPASSTNDLSPTPSYLSYPLPLKKSIGQLYDLTEIDLDVNRMNQENKSQYSMEGIRNMFAETYHSNSLPLQQQSCRIIDPTWQSWRRDDSPPIPRNAIPCQLDGHSDMYSNISTGRPMDLNVGAPFGYNPGYENSYVGQDKSFGTDVSMSDDWWKGTDNSMETQPCTATLAPPPMEYIGTRSVKGPPALQHAPPGLSNTSNLQTQSNRNPVPNRPPGLVPPPPGFGGMNNHNSMSDSNLQSMQYYYHHQQQQQQQQLQQQQQAFRDNSSALWTANPFHGSNG